MQKGDICQEVCPFNTDREPGRQWDKETCAETRALFPLPASASERSVEGWGEVGASVLHWSVPTAEPAFQPRPFLKDIKDVKDLLYLTQEQFSAAFKGSAVKRAKWNGLRRNSTAALSVPSSRR